MIKRTRRYTMERLQKFGQWIQGESWETLYDAAGGMAVQFTKMMFAKLDEIFPEEEVKITKLDGNITSLALQRLARARLREYTLHGSSDKFKELKRKQKARIKQEGQKRLNKEIEDAEGKGTRWMQEAKRLSARPGEDTSSTFTLPSHVDRNLTAKESAEAIASFFSKISQEFTPIEEDDLPPEVQSKLEKDICEHPAIREHEVFEKMKAAKKTDSVPGDIPKTILKEFLPELATPITSIIKQAVESHTWPEVYKKEFHLPIKKSPFPESEDDIRGIGLTAWASKQLERFVLDWIWPYIRPHMDPDQLGGMPGCSVEHYIVKMMDFILRSLDGDPGSAVAGVAVDYSKAFNRILHSNTICLLSALCVPTCAIKLIKSYLTQRSMCVRYKGEQSEFRKMPGGGPQGGLLTGILFCLQVNKVGSPCPLPSRALQLLQVQHPASQQVGKLPPVSSHDKDPAFGQSELNLPVNKPIEESGLVECEVDVTDNGQTEDPDLGQNEVDLSANEQTEDPSLVQSDAVLLDTGPFGEPAPQVQHPASQQVEKLKTVSSQVQDKDPTLGQSEVSLSANEQIEDPALVQSEAVLPVTGPFGEPALQGQHPASQQVGKPLQVTSQVQDKDPALEQSEVNLPANESIEESALVQSDVTLSDNEHTEEPALRQREDVIPVNQQTKETDHGKDEVDLPVNEQIEGPALAQSEAVLPVNGPIEEPAIWQSEVVLPDNGHTEGQSEVNLLVNVPIEEPALEQREVVLPVNQQTNDPGLAQNETIEYQALVQSEAAFLANRPTEEPAQGQSGGGVPVNGPLEDPTLGQNVMLLPPCHQRNKLNKEAYIDDLTMLEKISLLDLVEKERIIGPPDFHDRFHLTLPREKFILQHQLEDLKKETKKNSMLLNNKKTKSILFTTSQTKDFMPELSLEEGTILEVVFRIKLVGLVITNDMSWEEHIKYTIGRVNRVMWQLTRFKQHGASREKLITFYILKIRSILMFGCVCFHSALNSEQRQNLELQQKRGLIIILGSEYRNYSNARSITNLPSLEQLREEICLRWATKAQADPKHKHLFPMNTSQNDTRNRKEFIEHKCHGSRYFNSAVPAMARALNKHGVHPAGSTRPFNLTTNSGEILIIS